MDRKRFLSTCKDFTFKTLNGSRHHLVEDVVGSFQRLLRDYTGLLQQIYKSNVFTLLLEDQEPTYRSQCRHRPVYQLGRSEYG